MPKERSPLVQRLALPHRDTRWANTHTGAARLPCRKTPTARIAHALTAIDTVVTCSGTTCAVRQFRFSIGGWTEHAITKSVRNVSLPEKQSKVVYLATDVLNYTNAGVFVSTNQGATFKNVTGTLPERVVKDIALHPTNVKRAYVALMNSGVYLTTNQGKSWKAMNQGLTVQQATALLLNPISPNSLLLGIKGGMVYRSTNGGGVWTLVTTVTGDVTAFAADPKNKEVYYLGTNKRAVYKSIDSGATWVQKAVGLAGATTNSITSIVADPLNTANVYLAMSKKGVFKSTNGGESWTQKKSGLKNIKINDLVLYKKTPSILYAATDGSGVFKSTDSATTWTQFDKLNLTELKVLSIALDQVTGKHLFAGTANAVFDYTLDAVNRDQLPLAGVEQGREAANVQEVTVR